MPDYLIERSVTDVARPSSLNYIKVENNMHAFTHCPEVSDRKRVVMQAFTDSLTNDH